MFPGHKFISLSSYGKMWKWSIGRIAWEFLLRKGTPLCIKLVCLLDVFFTSHGNRNSYWLGEDMQNKSPGLKKQKEKVTWQHMSLLKLVNELVSARIFSQNRMWFKQMPVWDILGSASLMSLLHSKVKVEIHRRLTASLSVASQKAILTIDKNVLVAI